MSLREFLDEVRADRPATLAVVEDLRLGGRNVRLRFASDGLARHLGRALRHLRQPWAGAAELTVDCWAGVEPRPLALPAGWPTQGTVAVDDGTASLTWERPDGPLVIYDRSTRQGWTRFARPDGLSPWERATPFRMLLHQWSAAEGLQLVHAASVGAPGGGVLLVGRGGSGKSTTALACLAAGLGYAGDDYCLVEPGERPWVHSLYLSGKGNARTAALLPTLRDALLRAPDTTDGKSILFADDVRPAAVVVGFPLRGIVVPRIVGGPTSQLQPLSPTAALRALAPSTLLQLPGGRAGGLGRLSGLVRAVPAWELQLGSDPATAVPLIAGLVDPPPGARSFEK